MKKIFRTALLIANIMLLTPVFSQPGSLDPTFGIGGKVTTTIGTSGDYGRSVAIQPDGKILVAGYTYNNGTIYDFALVRYNNDGTLDNSFGTSGKVTTAIGIYYDYGRSVAIQPDGKILVGGTSSNGSDDDFALARYNSNGSVDNTFGIGGKVLTAIGNVDDVGYSVAIQSDGKIVVAGYTYDGTANFDFALARYNSNGSLDSAFSSDGKVTTDFGSNYDIGYSVAIQNDGKIVEAGFSYNGSALVRYNSNGILDTTFGSGGKVTTYIGSYDDHTYSITIQGDGKIVLAGSYGFYDFYLARYNSNGALDNAFGIGGMWNAGMGSYYEDARSVAIQADGKILLAGTRYNGSNDDFALFRHNTDGTFDLTFDSDGKVTTDFGNSYEGGCSIAIQNDGKIVLAGYTNYGPDWDFAIARYIGGDPVGIQDASTTLNVISIYPNPASETIMFRYHLSSPDKGLLEIYSVIGNKVAAFNLPSNKEQFEIPLTGIDKGIYLYRFSVNGLPVDAGKLVVTK